MTPSASGDGTFDARVVDADGNVHLVVEGYRIRVERMDGRRVDRVRLAAVPLPTIPVATAGPGGVPGTTLPLVTPPGGGEPSGGTRFDSDAT